MQVLRKYKKLDWFEFVDVITAQLGNRPTASTYFEMMDELEMRMAESISEGASFKYKKQAQELALQFISRHKSDAHFATEAQLKDFKQRASFKALPSRG